MKKGRETDDRAQTIRALARAVLDADSTAFRPRALVQAKLLLLDTIGCGLAGAREEVAQRVAEVALNGANSPRCALMGRPERAGVLDAVLINGVAIRVLDLNDYITGHSDGEPEAGGHPSDNIPVALAVGGPRGSSGADVLHAIIVGYEVYARLQSLMDRGGIWDGVSVSGIVAAAMAGRLIGLDEERMAHALALGAARAATPAIVRTGDISAAKSIANALVAQSGVQAALLAESGLTGPLAILDDDRGLLHLFATAGISKLTGPIRSESAILRAHIKTYPCINTGQSAVEAALTLHDMMKGEIENLARIDVVMADYRVIKRQQEDPGRTHPISREAADHSFPFLVAVSLLDGAFGLAQFEGERWRDPRVQGIMGKIAMSRDAAWAARAPGAYPCTIRARTHEGREWSAQVPYPPGFSQDGLDEAAVIEKFHAVAAPILDLPARQRIVYAVMELHHSPSIASLEAAIATKGTTT